MQRTSLLKLSCVLLCTGIISIAQAADIGTARSRYQSGQLKQALAETNRIIQSQPGSVDALFLKAQIQADTSNTNAAIDSYKAVIAIDPEHMESYNNLAALYAQQGKLELASEALENAINTDPVFATVYANLRAIYIEMSKKHYRQALKLKPAQRRTQIAAIDIGSNNEQILDQEILLVPESIQAAVNTTVTAKIEKPIAVAQPVPVAKTAAPKKVPEATKAEATDTQQQKPKEKAIKKPEAKKAAAVVEPKGTEPKTTKPKTAEPKKAQARANPEIEVKKALLSWANAWSNRDADKYIKAYRKGYAPIGKTTKDWAAGRRWNFKTKKYIKVTLSNIKITSNDKKFRAKFKQSYESNTYKDVVKKELVFTKEAGRWKISAERSL